jgi:hypothetical protein
MQMGIESWAGRLSINYQVPLLASVREALTALSAAVPRDWLNQMTPVAIY